MGEPKVSVIIPVYNVEAYLRECLDSVINQTLKEIEIICVNDGSTDNSLSILREYADADGRVIVFTQENAGQSAARNYGLRAASGTYVYFLDSDDFLRSDALELLYSAAQTHRTDILFFGADSVYETEALRKQHSTYLEYYHRQALTEGAVSGEEMIQIFTEKLLFRASVPLQFFRRAFLEKTGLRFMEGIVHEDELFSPLVLLKAERVMCVPENLYFRRVRGGSTMFGNGLIRKFNGQFTVFVKLLGEYISGGWGDTPAGNALLTRAKNLYSASKATYQQLSVQEQKKLLGGHSPGDIFLFRELDYSKLAKTENLLKSLETASMTKSEMEREIDLLRSKTVELNEEIIAIHSSWTYRIGRAATFFPRKLRGGIRCYQEHGMKYTLRRLLEQLGLGPLLERIRLKREERKKKKENRPQKPTGKVLVSVIVPVYNAEKYLRQCIDSILAQTLPDFELICVDDGSADKSVEIIREYQKKDKRVKLLKQKNQYAGVARNNGLGIARGKYLMFLDADDFFEPSLLGELYAAAERDSADVCICAADRYQTQTGVFEKAGWLLNTRYLPQKRPFNRADCSRHIFQVSSPAPWTKMFRKEFVMQKQLRFQNLQRSNDLYFTLSAIALAERISVVEKELVHYRVGQSTNLQSKNHLTPMLFCEALCALKQQLVQTGVWEEVRGSFSDLAMNTSVYNLKTLTDETRAVVLKEFKNRLAAEFELFAHDREFYSLKANYDYMKEALS